ncbi:phosphoribosylformylglycinamidine synthase [Alkalithermobacter thermoalcaliphilus JW-YL-7 = DSM 7308]|uniref:Phosphoribosylformylglycinamidine synthase n=1 Tax=Alkalithermobacter thermoalcaliphilus JW-YL-7 = DSM 7308 TaxID=1121328 RepID=A0A150FPK9_CLOPD|nr:phosphoribosylformylglycinamidine synthase [[Clostridium] paradoxum JW-YL-7 = DSM 7308]SHK91034.1 phosphoribosylformylglycinamidine synthase [[Clostridium] paradoxum JW-YL-7 = DSM 7308]
MENIKRVFVEKKSGFNVEAMNLLKDLKENLKINNLENVRIINRYDISGITDDIYQRACKTIFSEPPVDNVYHEEIKLDSDEIQFGIQYLPGQYDQRADWASQCIQILTQGKKVTVVTAKIIVLKGKITDSDLEKIKKYCINPIDSKEAYLGKYESLDIQLQDPDPVAILEGFIDLDDKQLIKFLDENELSMTLEDIKFCQEYFKNIQKRNPTITEIKVIDTYWSDHCRHTTFLTNINNIKIQEGKFSKAIQKAYDNYLDVRKFVYEGKDKDISLMDIATIGMKELKKKGLLDDLDESEEVNACSIKVSVDVDGKNEDWLVMFKNETHNHPTEIEPFGGAATCIGGAIRDPLSGRSYVYQAMRITGSADPRKSIEDTIKGKLPQRKITTEAAAGYSSYGNQIGLATGYVCEVYDEDFVAKRMEVGAVIAAAPLENVVRKRPKPGDVIILVGGRTGRDGCGGATGSSKEHNENSIITCSAQVQKGNAPTERKLQRLFKNPNASRLIKKCNDFGAGGVCVAIGELCDGVDINLDLVPKKYEGLDGTEIAISESQERMAVVVDKEDAKEFIKYANDENLEATVVAFVTDKNRLTMTFKDQKIVDIDRDFLNTNGVKQNTDAVIKCVDEEKTYFDINLDLDIKSEWLEKLKDLNVCSQKGLVERFDSTIGSSTVLMPFGGKYKNTPIEGMVAKIPVLSKDTNTATIMAHGYNPKLSKWSPFHGGIYSIIEAVTKVVAMGGDYKSIRLSLQEYFEKLGKDPIRWGKPLSALLGALLVQTKLQIPAIGGKDSMSGSFKDLDVPPTVVAFAVSTVNANHVISPEFKGIGNNVVLVFAPKDEYFIPKFDILKKNFEKINYLIKNGYVLSSHTVKHGGICEAISKMSFGNEIGIKFNENVTKEELFNPNYGSIILEIDKSINVDDILKGARYKVIGTTQSEKSIDINGIKIDIKDALKSFSQPLESVFPTDTEKINENIEPISYHSLKRSKSSIKIARPKVFIPVFPGTNCEYDTMKAFEKAGAKVDVRVFKNLTREDIQNSLDEIVEGINSSQILMLSGGFSAGDEPEGSGKFIATVFRNPKVKEAVMNFIKNKDGLILGICNGFQALIKLGLLPYGEIIDINENCPTLTYNKIGRHVSTVVNTKIVSNISPWFNNVKVGDVHSIVVSHGEGRFIASEDIMKMLIKNGQIATQYVDENKNPTYDIKYNPNGSLYAVEGITSSDGRILGKMGHSERVGSNVIKNIIGEKDQKIFQAGVDYFS